MQVRTAEWLSSTGPPSCRQDGASHSWEQARKHVQITVCKVPLSTKRIKSGNSTYLAQTSESGVWFRSLANQQFELDALGEDLIWQESSRSCSTIQQGIAWLVAVHWEEGGHSSEHRLTEMRDRLKTWEKLQLPGKTTRTHLQTIILYALYNLT